MKRKPKQPHAGWKASARRRHAVAGSELFQGAVYVEDREALLRPVNKEALDSAVQRLVQENPGRKVVEDRYYSIARGQALFDDAAPTRFNFALVREVRLR